MAPPDDRQSVLNDAAASTRQRTLSGLVERRTCIKRQKFDVLSGEPLPEIPVLAENQRFVEAARLLHKMTLHQTGMDREKAGMGQISRERFAQLRTYAILLTVFSYKGVSSIRASRQRVVAQLVNQARDVVFANPVICIQEHHIFALSLCQSGVPGRACASIGRTLVIANTPVGEGQ